jgi:PEP-CTERM motif
MRLFALRLFTCAAILVGVSAVPASASPITSLPNGSVIPMPGVNYFGTGPQAFSGVTWTSTNGFIQGGSVFGYTGGYGFIGNGFWDGGLGPMAGTNDPDSSSMTFTFATPVTGVGGFINYAPGAGRGPTTIFAYDSANNLLGSTVLTFSTGGGTNTGQFHGFLMNSPSISSFTLQGNYVGLTNLTVDATAPVPEPGTLVLFGTGACLLVARLRKRA